MVQDHRGPSIGVILRGLCGVPEQDTSGEEGRTGNIVRSRKFDRLERKGLNVG